MFLISQEDFITVDNIRSFNTNYFINMTEKRIIYFKAKINLSIHSNVFSTYGLNKNEWYIKKFARTYGIVEEFDNELTEDDILELKLRYNKLLIVSEFRNTNEKSNGMQNVMFTKFLNVTDKHLMLNQYFDTLVRMVKPEAIIFEGSSEDALIKYVKSVSNFKYVSYKEFLNYIE